MARSRASLLTHIGRGTNLTAVTLLVAVTLTLLSVSVISAYTWEPSSLSDVLTEAKSLSEWVVAQRRRLHMIPELCFKEVKTSEYLRQKLDELGIEYEYPVAGTGIKARIGNPKAGQPTVALRADIDALPIEGAVEVVLTGLWLAMLVPRLSN
jgi:hypothetical protein